MPKGQKKKADGSFHAMEMEAQAAALRFYGLECHMERQYEVLRRHPKSYVKIVDQYAKVAPPPGFQPPIRCEQRCVDEAKRILDKRCFTLSEYVAS